MSLRTYFAVIACGCLLAACGDDDPEPPRTTAATATATATATPTDTGTPTPAPTATPTATATATPEAEGGDEDGNRVEVAFDILPRGLQPSRIEVPAFLGLRLNLRNLARERRVVTLDGTPVAELAPEASETVDVDGLRPGDHTLESAERRATLVAVRAG